MSVEQIAQRLVALCREAKFEEAQNALYAEDAVSIEPEGLPEGALGSVRGLKAIRDKGREFQVRLEAVHGIVVSDALIAGNWFSLTMTMDVTMKQLGRVTMGEVCVYQVREGKIVREQFFYDVG